MAVPARKVSKTRKRMRRAHNALEVVTTNTCKECGASVKPHRACSKCRTYKGKKISKKEEK